MGAEEKKRTNSTTPVGSANAEGPTQRSLPNCATEPDHPEYPEPALHLTPGLHQTIPQPLEPSLNLTPGSFSEPSPNLVWAATPQISAVGERTRYKYMFVEVRFHDDYIITCNMAGASTVVRHYPAHERNRLVVGYQSTYLSRLSRTTLHLPRVLIGAPVNFSQEKLPKFASSQQRPNHLLWSPLREPPGLFPTLWGVWWFGDVLGVGAL